MVFWKDTYIWTFFQNVILKQQDRPVFIIMSLKMLNENICNY